MDFRADISFEYDYIRIVYEVILSNLRTNKKIIEKDINTIVTRLQNLKKKQGSMSNQDTITGVKNLISKINELEAKYDEICKEEELLYTSLKERINQLQMIDDKNYSFENLKIFCEKKLNNLLLDFFLREKFLETAKNYIEEEKIHSSVEYTIFLEIQKILINFKNRDLNEALNWCNANKSKLTKINSNIRFKLLKQQYLEIYKTGNILEAVKFSRENFAGLDNTKEISEIMLLLAIKPDHAHKWTKIVYLLSDDRWIDLENDFKQVFFAVYCMKSSSSLEVLFQSGLMSIKTPFCYADKNLKNLTCPVCCDEIGKLAKKLPSSHHPVSALICRITKEIMDHKNPPLALPNGQVFSEKAIIEGIKLNGGKFVCPVTNTEYKYEQCKKVFIC